MATTAYSTDDDLIKIRPNILDLGVAEWEERHQEAFDIINRVLITRWYRVVTPDRGIDWRLTEFDPDLADTSQLLRLSCYKTLELAYLYLMKDGPEADGFERNAKTFERKYGHELKEILGIGVNYDWDSNDEITYDEKYESAPRTLLRG